MRKTFLIFVLTLFTLPFSFAQKDWGVGIRAGEPLAVSFKKFLGNGNALEINVGSYGYAYGYGSRYRGNNGWGNNNYRVYNDRYYRRGGLVIMVDYLWQQDISDLEGLQWYAGFGGQLRSIRYLEDVDNDGDPDEERSAVGLGPNGVIGLEWFIPEIPELSVFLDLGLYAEIAPVGWLNLQAGVGVRYNF